jgi:hypothetical protein
VFDVEAWLPLAHGRIPEAELLSSGLARVLVRIVDQRGSYEEFALSVKHGFANYGRFAKLQS